MRRQVIANFFLSLWSYAADKPSKVDRETPHPQPGISSLEHRVRRGRGLIGTGPPDPLSPAGVALLEQWALDLFRIYTSLGQRAPCYH